MPSHSYTDVTIISFYMHANRRKVISLGNLLSRNAEQIQAMSKDEIDALVHNALRQWVADWSTWLFSEVRIGGECLGRISFKTVAQLEEK